MGKKLLNQIFYLMITKFTARRVVKAVRGKVGRTVPFIGSWLDVLSSVMNSIYWLNVAAFSVEDCLVGIV